MGDPSPDDLRCLARKYLVLGELRRARARGEAVPERRVFRDLAAEFPGALYELDRLPLPTIDERHQALVRAADGGVTEPWMCWMWSYHALMRAALRIKRWVYGARYYGFRDLPDHRIEAIAADATAHAGIFVDARFLRAVEHPPSGRISAVVFSRLSELYGAAPALIRETLFPRPGALRRPAL